MANLFLILLMDDDIESNPGPKIKPKKQDFFHAATISP